MSPTRLWWWEGGGELRCEATLAPSSLHSSRPNVGKSSSRIPGWTSAGLTPPPISQKETEASNGKEVSKGWCSCAYVSGAPAEAGRRWVPPRGPAVQSFQVPATTERELALLAGRARRRLVLPMLECSPHAAWPGWSGSGPTPSRWALRRATVRASRAAAPPGFRFCAGRTPATKACSVRSTCSTRPAPLPAVARSSLPSMPAPVGPRRSGLPPLPKDSVRCDG